MGHLQSDSLAVRFYSSSPLYLSGGYVALTIYLGFRSVSLVNPLLSMFMVVCMLASYFSPKRIQGVGHRIVLSSLVVLVSLIELYMTETELLLVYMMPLVPIAVMLLCRTWHAHLIIGFFLLAFGVVVSNPPSNLAQLFATTFGFLVLPIITLLNWLGVGLLWYSLPHSRIRKGTDSPDVRMPPYDLPVAVEAQSKVEEASPSEASYVASKPLNKQPMPVLPGGKPRAMVLLTLAEVEFYHAFATLDVAPAVHTSLDSTIPEVLEGDALLIGGVVRWLLLNPLAPDLLRGHSLNFSTSQLGTTQQGQLILRVVLSTGSQKKVVLHGFDLTNPLSTASDVWRTLHTHHSPTGSTAHFVVAVSNYKGGQGVSVAKESSAFASLSGADPLASSEVLLLEESVGESDAHRVIKSGVKRLWRAKTNEEALAILARNRVDLVVVDTTELGISAYQLAHSIRSSERSDRKIPLIALAWCRPSECGDACPGAWADHTLSKPFEAKVLLHLMRVALCSAGSGC